LLKNKAWQKTKVRAPVLRFQRRYPPSAGSVAEGNARARAFGDSQKLLFFCKL